MPEPDDNAPLDDEDLSELRSLVERGALGDIEWEPTHEELWHRIEADIGGGREATSTTAPAATPSPPTSRRRRRWRTGIAAVAAVAAAIVAVVIVAVNDDANEEVLSAIDLEPLTGTGSGRAELVNVDGSLRLRLNTADLDPADGYFEVWLIDPSVTAMVSLGPLRADGEYDVPSGVDAAAFPVVDVSIEPVDGDPTHSGESVLRGQLTI